jgi:tetratricopeptide (TPR) repeat protein
MTHLSRITLSFVLLACALSLAAQETKPNPEGASPASVPAIESSLVQVERIPPPNPALPAKDLEMEGDSLRAQKAYLDAIDYYKAALEKGETAALYNKIGVCLLQLEHYPQARKEFEHAVKLDKSFPEAHNNLGVANYEMKRYGAAVKEYQKAIKLNEDNASFHSNLGSAYFSRYDVDKASKEYARALELDPHIFDPQPSGGVSLKLATHGDRAFFHYLMAKMYGRQGNQERCRLYLNKANEEGYHVRDALKDQEFAGLRKDPTFVEFVRSLKPPPPAENRN